MGTSFVQIFTSLAHVNLVLTDAERASSIAFTLLLFGHKIVAGTLRCTTFPDHTGLSTRDELV